MGMNLTEEEMMALNSSFESNRKAMIRAGKEKHHNIEIAGNSIYVLERNCYDNLIHRQINSVIAVSERRENLIEFFHKNYRPDIDFNDNKITKMFNTDMGESSFQIAEVAFV